MERSALAAGLDLVGLSGCALLTALAAPPPPPLRPPPLALETPVVSMSPAARPLRAFPAACRETTYIDFYAHGRPQSVLIRTFDAAGRVASEETRVGDVVTQTRTYDYDRAGRLERETVRTNDDVETTVHHYDRAGHDVRLDSTSPGRGHWVTLQTYDASGRLATVRANIKPGAQRRGFGEWYRYDAAGRLVAKQQDNDEDGRPDLEVQYTYDERGLLVERREHWYDHYMVGDHDTFIYDAAGRVDSETDRRGFRWISSYDAAGNLVRKSRYVQTPGSDPFQRIEYDYSCW
jgi:YD repeat-containing protein